MSNLELTYQSFINRISKTAKKDVLFKLSRNTLITLTAFILLALLLTSLEAIFVFDSTTRKVILFAYISAFVSTALMILIHSFLGYRDLVQPSKINQYAKRIGSHYPEIKDNLLNAIQIYSYTKQNDRIFSNDLASETINQVNEKSKSLNFSGVISHKKNNRLILFFGLAFSIFTLLMLVLPNTFQAAANRIINYNFTFVENTLGIAYEVKPGNIEIAKGEAVDILAKIMFNDPNYKTDEITLNVKQVTNEGIEISSNSQKISSSGTNEFKTQLSGINANTIYWFEYKGIKSTAYNITITNRPVIKIAKITVYPPAYTKLPSRTIDGTEISTIAGSKIYVELEASDDLSKSFLQFSGGSPISLEVNGKTAVGSFTASSNGSFKMNIIKEYNDKELENVNPKDYQLRVYPDEYPKISILEPDNSETSVQGLKEILVRSRITDDFGFSKMRIGYKVVSSKFGPTDKEYRFSEMPIKNLDATGLEVPYLWNISGLNLATEDEVEYFVEVYDNDGVSGPKMSRSEIRKLVYPSLEALLNKTEKTKDELEKELQSAYQDALELKKELDEIKDKLDKNPEELGLNDPLKNQELQQKLQNMQNNLSNTQQKLDDLMKELQQNSQISKETLDKYMELQKLFQKIDSQELRDALKKLQEAMKNFNKDELKEAMKNFKFDEENFKKSLEKTMELLNKILTEQKFGELTQKLDDITRKQDDVKNETKNTPQNDNNKLNELSKSQEQVKKDYEEFQKQMKELQENMKKFGNQQISKEMQKMLEEMMKKQLEQKMQNSAQDLQNSNKNNSQQKQDEISKDLNQMNQQMQDMLAQMLEQENQKLMAKMQEFLDRLQEMSKKQGELKEQSEELNKSSDSKEFKENQQQQQQLQNQLSNLIEEMMSMAQQMGMNPQMSKNLGDAYNEMQKAVDQLGKKEGKNANKSQGNAKEHLDNAIGKMQQMCQTGKSGKNGKPSMSLNQLLQQLQQLIQRQQSLNQQMPGFQPNGNQGQLNQEQMAQMQKLALEQQQLKENLNQLNDEFKKQQEIDGKKLLGNLDEVQKDMMEVIKDLQENNVTAETKKRQEKILSRMLDFQLSAREKDFEQRRESRPGKNFDRSSPPEIVISKPNIINGINQDALELQKENYSEDYETLIQKYMEKVKNKNQ